LCLRETDEGIINIFWLITRTSFHTYARSCLTPQNRSFKPKRSDEIGAKKVILFHCRALLKVVTPKSQPEISL